MPDAPAEQRLDLELTLTIKATDILVRLSGFGKQHVDQYTMRINTMGFSPYDDRSVDIPVYENVDTVSGIMHSLIPDKDYHLNIFVFLRGAQSVVMWDYHADIHTDVDPTEGQHWSWRKSNGKATTLQTQNAYNAIRSHGLTVNFSTVVWDDLVWFVDGILKSNGQSFGFNDAEHTTFAYWEGQWWDHTLTASQFSSLQRALRWPYFSWITDPDSPGYIPPVYPHTDHPLRGDKVYGYYFTELAWAANVLIDAYSGVYDSMEIVQQYMSVTHSLTAVCARIAPLNALLTFINFLDDVSLNSRPLKALVTPYVPQNLSEEASLRADNAAHVQIRSDILMIDAAKLVIDNIRYIDVSITSMLTVYSTLLQRAIQQVSIDAVCGSLTASSSPVAVQRLLLQQHTVIQDINTQALMVQRMALGLGAAASMLISNSVYMEVDNVHLLNLKLHDYNFMYVTGNLGKTIATVVAAVQDLHLTTYNILVSSMITCVAAEQLLSLATTNDLCEVAIKLLNTATDMYLTAQHVLGLGTPEPLQISNVITPAFDISTLGLGNPFALYVSTDMAHDLVPSLTVSDIPSTPVAGNISAAAQFTAWLSTNDVEISDAFVRLTFVGAATELFVTDGGNLSGMLGGSFRPIAALLLLGTAELPSELVAQFITNSTLTAGSTQLFSAAATFDYVATGTLIGYNSFLPSAASVINTLLTCNATSVAPAYTRSNLIVTGSFIAALLAGIETCIFSSSITAVAITGTLHTGYMRHALGQLSVDLAAEAAVELKRWVRFTNGGLILQYLLASGILATTYAAKIHSYIQYVTDFNAALSITQAPPGGSLISGLRVVTLPSFSTLRLMGPVYMPEAAATATTQHMGSIVQEIPHHMAGSSIVASGTYFASATLKDATAFSAISIFATYSSSGTLQMAQALAAMDVQQLLTDMQLSSEIMLRSNHSLNLTTSIHVCCYAPITLCIDVAAIFEELCLYQGLALSTTDSVLSDYAATAVCVSSGWINPVLVNHRLLIFQVHGVEQEENVLVLG